MCCAYCEDIVFSCFADEERLVATMCCAHCENKGCPHICVSLCHLAALASFWQLCDVLFVRTSGQIFEKLGPTILVSAAMCFVYCEDSEVN